MGQEQERQLERYFFLLLYLPTFFGMDAMQQAQNCTLVAALVYSQEVGGKSVIAASVGGGLSSQSSYYFVSIRTGRHVQDANQIPSAMLQVLSLVQVSQPRNFLYSRASWMDKNACS